MSVLLVGHNCKSLIVRNDFLVSNISSQRIKAQRPLQRLSTPLILFFVGKYR
jgi:hypothetical protein